MFRLGLSGTNWTGKSETIRRFVQTHPDLPIRTVSLSSLVAKCPFPMMENQTVDGSKWMVEQVRTMCASKNGEIELFDRTPLDILAFTLYAMNRTGERSQVVLEDCLGLVRYFDRLFYLPLSDEWPTAGSQTQSQIRFARQVDFYIRRAIKEFSLEVFALPWELDERQDLLSECLLPLAPACKGGR
jgi:hypothetical protein